MRTHVALLRGVNVGGHNRLPMAELRRVVTALGHTEVATYIQSGNVVFATPEVDTTALAGELERALAEAVGFRPATVVLSREELARVVADNPFPDETNPRALHAVFRADEPGPDVLADLEAAVARARGKGSTDDARLVGRTVYLRTPDGLGRSELAAELSCAGGTRRASEAGTARNRATVTKLLALLDA